jgi:hypothetical protein
MAATWRVHPGRQEDFVKLANDWKPIGERFKMNNQQLLQVAAGNAEMPFNTVIYTAEFAKGTDYGAWLDSQGTDPGIQEWFAKALGENGPADLVASTIMTEVRGF